MALLDKMNEFCDSTTALTGTAAAAVLGNVLDLGNVTAYPGNSCVYCVIKIPTAFTSNGSATTKFELRSDDTASIHATTSTLHYATGAIPVATLAAGYTAAAFEIPRGAYERYLGIIQTNATAELTAGKVDAYLTTEPPTEPTVFFPDAL